MPNNNVNGVTEKEDFHTLLIPNLSTFYIDQDSQQQILSSEN